MLDLLQFIKSQKQFQLFGATKQVLIKSIEMYGFDKAPTLFKQVLY